MSGPAQESIFYRVWRLTRLFAHSVFASRGLGGKMAMIRCIWGWLMARLGRAGASYEVTLRLPNITMTVDPTRLEIAPYWEMWYEDDYELLPQFRATDKTTLVDVGGNVGFYSIRQAQRAKHGRVISFEPAPSTFSRFQRNIEANGLTNLHVYNEAMGATSGVVHFVESKWSINCKVVPEKTADSIEVQCSTLDDAMERLKVEHIDILKVDTEGFERSVLSGACKTLPRTDRVVLEVHKDPEGEKKAIDAMLAPHGFKPVARQGALIYYEKSAQGA